jgi:hypothetical protein
MARWKGTLIKTFKIGITPYGILIKGFRKSKLKILSNVPGMDWQARFYPPDIFISIKDGVCP